MSGLIGDFNISWRSLLAVQLVGRGAETTLQLLPVVPSPPSALCPGHSTLTWSGELHLGTLRAPEEQALMIRYLNGAAAWLAQPPHLRGTSLVRMELT